MRHTFGQLGWNVRAVVMTAAVATAAAAFTAPAGHAASASASSSSSVVQATRWVDGCEAILYSNASLQASAGVYMSRTADATYRCTGWLERSADGGKSFTTVSGYHTISTPGASSYTGWYYDSAPDVSKACVEEEPLIAGNVLTVCTAAW
ncbi:hypothetical protein [Actinacidiphila bryophytorum]|uniref:Spore-associated protein A n=1 Tax=Actinacidiphila bryophytorum TaxID=1436133 RepID=A0A9W4H2K4_9ACTN|nr:hypothetical protein [Actinacidiphila bryophytorum]MBM9440334.1 hypothetical protein [Actinacidiphila bryophytorum]MBN6543398.1 hypothetical protein [Actinacidiphila bryophytorum]CAG7645539.1 conserved exported hypothetical protein [Actinacidiphila bryophytorum]